MHKKWSTYVYLESDTTSRNSEVEITKFTVTRRPLQVTHFTKIRFLPHCFWKQLLLLFSVLQFCVKHLKTLPYTKSYIAFLAVHCSAFFHTFPGLALVSLRAHTTALGFSLQLSMCRWNPIYKMVSPYQSASWTARLTLHLNFCTGTSKQSLGDFFIENFQRHFFIACFVVQDMSIDQYHQVEQTKEKFLPPFYRLSFKWIRQHLIGSVHISFMHAGQHCSWFYFTMCHPWQWCLNKNIFMGSG